MSLDKPNLDIQRKAYLQVGVIVSQVNRVEKEINKLIAAYYAQNDRVRILVEDIFEDPRMSLSLKLDIFSKVALNLDGNYLASETKNDLKTWLKIRNTVGHGVVGEVNGRVVVSHRGRVHPLTGKFNEFARKQESIVAYIHGLLEKEK